MGEPVFVIGALVGCWILARTMLWQSPLAEFPDAQSELAPLGSNGRIASGSGAGMTAPSEQDQEIELAVESVAPSDSVVGMAQPIPPNASEPSAGQSRPSVDHGIISIAPPVNVRVTTEAAELNRQKRVVGAASGSSLSLRSERKPKRWSLHSWAFYRPDSRLRTSPSQLPPTYGASQAGAVLRFQFSKKATQRPFAYLRASAALSGPRQADIATGLGARPVARIPVTAMAELRVSRNDGRKEIRPAGLAVTELPPIELPLDARGEIYAQAGYVGGNFATAFVDGQARVDREIVDFDLASVRLGAGIWGGAQKGAARLDAGPTANVQIRLANRPVRLALDYRRRIAGNARPQSGIALTLSTGF